MRTPRAEPCSSFLFPLCSRWLRSEGHTATSPRFPRVDWCGSKSCAVRSRSRPRVFDQDGAIFGCQESDRRVTRRGLPSGAPLISELSRTDDTVRPATCHVLRTPSPHICSKLPVTSGRSRELPGHRDLSTMRIYVSALNQDKCGPAKSARSAGRRARSPAKPAGILALSRPAYSTSVP